MDREVCLVMIVWCMMMPVVDSESAPLLQRVRGVVCCMMMPVVDSESAPLLQRARRGREGLGGGGALRKEGRVWGSARWFLAGGVEKRGWLVG